MGRTRRSCLSFYVVHHWILICCGYDYPKYLLLGKTGDHNLIKQDSRSQARMCTKQKKWTEGGQGGEGMLGIHELNSQAQKPVT